MLRHPFQASYMETTSKGSLMPNGPELEVNKVLKPRIVIDFRSLNSSSMHPFFLGPTHLDVVKQGLRSGDSYDSLRLCSRRDVHRLLAQIDRDRQAENYASQDFGYQTIHA